MPSARALRYLRLIVAVFAVAGVSYVAFPIVARLAAGDQPSATSSALAEAPPASATPLATLAISPDKNDSATLCTPANATRAGCAQNAVGRDANAPQALLAMAHKAGIKRIVLFLPGFSAKFSQGREWSSALQARFGPDFGVVYVDWGTHGSKAEYEADARSAKRSAPAVARFVEGMHAADPTFPLDIFAHSMGCRVATGTIAALRNASDARPYVEETVLAAPDVNFVDFQHAVARNPKPFGGVTIYVSQYDKALALSSFVHLHHRLGQLADWHRALPSTTVVDASAAKRVVGGHGYALYDPAIIDDVRADFEHAAIPHASWKQDGFVWKYVPPSAAVSLSR